MSEGGHDSAERNARLAEAHLMAARLLDSAEAAGLFRPGVGELALSRELQALGREMFGRFKHWHKRLVRAGANTLHPYSVSPPELVIGEDDIMFVDLGPLFDAWEADIGRTYVIGGDPDKLRLRDSVEAAWRAGRDHFKRHRETVTGAEMHALAVAAAEAAGYRFGNVHAGHLIGRFPHKAAGGAREANYLHPANHGRLADPDRSGNPRDWIYEIHFVDPERGYGGFFEQWLELDD